jgi:RNA-directed DNA polymerase
MTEQDGTNLIERIASMENILQAMKHVISKKGKGGIDGIEADELEAHIHKYLKPLQRKLLDASYQPQPIQRVYIPKKNGGKRPLGIPILRDRVVQQAILQVINPIIDPSFSEFSYGFRKKRSAKMAIKQAEEYYEQGYKVAVDFDLKDFFSTINHQKLMSLVSYYIKDKAVLKLLQKFQETDIFDNGLRIANEEGVAQGGPISPLLANIYLNQLDRELEKRGHKFVRYADDFVIYVKSQRAGERVLESVGKYLEETLRLVVNKEKSKVTSPTSGVFLSFTLGHVKGK